MVDRIICTQTLKLDTDFEVVECKGKGHPDTLSDALGERLSITYSNYCLQNFGIILHHNFDKVGIMGGLSRVGFGVGEILEPIRVLINGRASSSFGSQLIDLKELFLNEINVFFREIFPHIADIDGLYKVMWEVSTGSSPGAISSEDSYRQHWFKPRGRKDLSELKRLNCNDTSMGCAYYGNTKIEEFVLAVEERLNSKEFKTDKPWLGTDIKQMCCKSGSKVSLTLCVPQIGPFVSGLNEYKNNLELIKQEIRLLSMTIIPDSKLTINLNMRDKFDIEAKDLYLTYTGSSIEMGDEGFVGRGNRYGGLITPNRFYSMEGIAGKNPIYHTGKMYSVIAFEVSKKIWEYFNYNSETILVGITGQPLMEPHQIIINSDGLIPIIEIKNIIDNMSPNEITQNIINSKYRLF